MLTLFSPNFVINNLTITGKIIENITSSIAFILKYPFANNIVANSQLQIPNVLKQKKLSSTYKVSRKQDANYKIFQDVDG